MMHLGKRLEKIEELVKMKNCGVDIVDRGMTDEEKRKVSHENFKRPVKALFVLISQVLLDVYHLPEEAFKKIYRDFLDGAQQLFTLDELTEMGHESREGDFEEYENFEF